MTGVMGEVRTGCKSRPYMELAEMPIHLLSPRCAVCSFGRYTCFWSRFGIPERLDLVQPIKKFRCCSHLVRSILFGALLACIGCQEPLLSPDEPRSQYDRYDAVRDQRAATVYTDEFGYKRPNLRGRLLPKE